MKQLLMIALLLGVVSGAAAQEEPLMRILGEIERNNPELQALRQEAEAARMEVRTENNLEDPAVEYSPFYAKGVDGMASSELVVKQGFDFPTRYLARSRSGRSREAVIDDNWRIARRDLLLEAKRLCLDLIRLHRERQLLDERLRNADDLLQLFGRRLEQGDATAIEVNKIRMERMTLRTELAANESAAATALRSLEAMNGDLPIVVDGLAYPVGRVETDFTHFREQQLAAALEIAASQSEVRASEQELRLNRQNWLPSLEVGYRRNTALDEKSHGFLVGASFPIFSNRHKTRIAQARHTASQLRLESTVQQTEAYIRSRFDELQRMRETLGEYDLELMHRTLGLLRRAVESGQLSIIEYYTEADGIYANLLAYETLENDYQKLQAELTKNDL